MMSADRSRRQRRRVGPVRPGLKADWSYLLSRQGTVRRLSGGTARKAYVAATAYQVGIDGARQIAERRASMRGLRRGRTGADLMGKWVDVWDWPPSPLPPHRLALFGATSHTHYGRWSPAYDSYVQRTREAVSPLGSLETHANGMLANALNPWASGRLHPHELSRGLARCGHGR